MTYVLRGELEVAHSGGHPAVLQAGDVQWTTVGRQVDQTDGPGRQARERSELLRVIRLWVRLPPKLAEVEPRFQEFKAAKIPEVHWPPGKASVRAALTSPAVRPNPVTPDGPR